MAKSSKKPRKSAAKTATKKTQAKQPSESNVTRIKASDESPKKPGRVRSAVHKLTAREKAEVEMNKGFEPGSDMPSKREELEQKLEKQSGRRRNPLRAIREYFAGAWYELRQVRWPDRANTLQMTAALLVFTFFIGTIIVLLDALFRYLFELMVG